MKKLLVILSVLSLAIIGGMVANAAPITPVVGGGTGTSTLPANGYLLIGNGTSYQFIASSSLSGAGLSSSTIQALFSATAPIVYNSSTGGFSWINSNGYLNTASATLLYYPLSGNPSGFITTSTNNFGGVTGTGTTGNCTSWSAAKVLTDSGSPCGSGGGGGTVGPSTSTYFTFFNGSSTVTGSSTFSTQSFDTIKYADQFSGVDMGAQINAAYASCPTSGCEIIIPGGTWYYATPIVINRYQVPALIMGTGGGGFYHAAPTTLVYTSSTGIGFTYNVAQYASGGIGLQNLSLVGPAGVYAGGTTGVGSSTTVSNTTSTQAIHLGGSNGATGFLLKGVQISGWGKGVVYDNNTFVTTLDTDAIQYNGMNIYYPNATNAFENNRVTNSVIADSQYGTGSIATNCVYLNNNSGADWQFSNDSFDDCQVNVAAVGAKGTIVHFTNNHFENPNYGGTGCYDYITTPAGETYDTSISSVGNNYARGGPTSCPEFVKNGASFSSFGDNLYGYSSNATNTLTFVTNQDSLDPFIWSGLTQNNSSYNAGQTVNVYGSNAFTQEGYGFGSAAPSYSIGTSGNTAMQTLSIGASTPITSLDVGGQWVSGTGAFSSNNPVADFTTSTIAVSGIVTYNSNTGGSAESRIATQDTSGHWFGFITASVNSTSTLMGQSRSSTDYLVNNAGTPRNILVGTVGPSSSVIFGTNSNSRMIMTSNGHIGFATSTPTVSSCGTNATSTGSDNGGIITIGTGGITACTLTFAIPWTVLPVPSANDSSSTDAVQISALSTSTVTFSFPLSITAGSIYYRFQGNSINP
jgi:hypothetical protein